MEEMEPEEEVIEEDEEFIDFNLSIEPTDGYINILLMGLDSRDMTTFEGSRSDMMIVAAINTNTYDVTLTSLYRDVLTKIGNTITCVLYG